MKNEKLKMQKSGARECKFKDWPPLSEVSPR